MFRMYSNKYIQIDTQVISITHTHTYTPLALAEFTLI